MSARADKKRGVNYIRADATKMDFTRYKDSTVLIKWMLCHLTDTAAVQLLSALGDQGCRVYVVESCCAKSKPSRGKDEPFYERTESCWSELAMKARMQLALIWRERLPGLAQQACFHLERKESEVKVVPVPNNKRSTKQ